MLESSDSQQRVSFVVCFIPDQMSYHIIVANGDQTCILPLIFRSREDAIATCDMIVRICVEKGFIEQHPESSVKFDLDNSVDLIPRGGPDRKEE